MIEVIPPTETLYHRGYRHRLLCDRCTTRHLESTGEALGLALYARARGWLVGLALIQIGKLDAPTICPVCRSQMEGEVKEGLPPNSLIPDGAA